MKIDLEKDAWAVLRDKAVAVRFKENKDEENEKCKCVQCRNPHYDGICAESSFEFLSKCGCDGLHMCTKHAIMTFNGNKEEQKEALTLRDQLLSLRQDMDGNLCE